MAGTIVTDRIESDASFASKVEIASPLVLSNTFAIPAGTVGAPALSPVGDTNTGIYFPAADAIGISTNGVDRVRVDSAGNVGVGTNSPTYPLTVGNNKQIGGLNTTGAGVTFAIVNGSNNLVFGDDSVNTGTLTIQSRSNMIFSLNTAERMRIDSAGNVGIGTSTPGAKLDVNGVVRGTRFSTLEQQYVVSTSSFDWDITSIIGTIPDVENSITFELTLRERSSFSNQLFRLFYIRVGPGTTFDISSAVVSFGSSAATTTISYPSAGTLRFTNITFSVGDAYLRRISS
jgi:hypothetical protein